MVSNRPDSLTIEIQFLNGDNAKGIVSFRNVCYYSLVICEKCKQEYQEDYRRDRQRPSRFCSSKCAKSRINNTPKRYDWKLIQVYLNERMTHNEIREKVGVSSGAISNAIYWGWIVKPSFQANTRVVDINRSKARCLYIEKIKRDYGIDQIIPAFNPSACKIIEKYGEQNGYKFQHALNGGEFYIENLGYWVDGYDKEQNTVIEYHERRHKYQTERDENRKKQIIDHLNCNFIIIWEE